MPFVALMAEPSGKFDEVRIGIPEAEEHGADTGLGSSPFFFSSSVFGI